MKKIILVLFAFFCNLFFISCANAENFVIDNYDVNLNVNEDRSVNITENIDTFFTKQSHGIVRTIPIKNKIIREDGTENNEFSKVTDIEATQFNSKFVYGNNVVIKLGNADKLIEGRQNYNIKYKYYAGNDKVRGKDEFYFNIIGTEWDTPINKVHFTVTLPKEFDASKVGFSMGTKGVSGYNPEHLVFNINGNTIQGESLRPLNPKEGITIRMELPDKYFTQTLGFEAYMIILTIILMLIPVTMWAMFGKDDPVTPVVNFTAPEGRNSAEVEVEYSGISTAKGITSLIFYLASKGYLEIEDDGICYVIKKLKQYDGDNAAEKALMAALFTGDKESVTQIEIEASSTFCLYATKIRESLNRLKTKLFVKDSCSFGKLSVIIVAILAIFGLFLYTIAGYSFDLLFSPNAFILIFPIIAVAVFILMASSKNIVLILFATVWSLGFGGIPTAMLLMEGLLKVDSNNLPVLLVQLASIVASIICLVNMPKRSQKGRMALGQLLGLKKYLEVAEKRRLLSIMEENPNYCSEILPFAYVLGVADNLIDTIDGYDNYKPAWYRGNFTKNRFKTFSNSLQSSAVPVSSGSSGSGYHRGGHGHSGGGRSGGGHGGGGGHSW